MEVLDIFEELISDDEENLDAINIIENPRSRRVFKPRIDNMNLWLDHEFINRFRISKASVEELLQQIGNHLRRNTNQ